MATEKEILLCFLNGDIQRHIAYRVWNTFSHPPETRELLYDK